MFEEPTPEMIALIEQMFGTIPQPNGYDDSDS